MKYFIYPILIILLTSCGGFKIDRKASISQSDVLEKESLNRYDNFKIDNNINKKDFLLQGLVLCYQGNVNKGLNYLKGFAIKEKDNSKYWQKVATCHYLDSNHAKAEFYNKLALKNSTSKDKAAIFNNLGLIYLRKGHFEQAKKSFLKALSKNKNLKTPKYNLSQLYIKFGLFNMAIKELNTLAKVSPKDIELIKAIAICQTQKGDFKKAIKQFVKIPSKTRKRADIAVYYAQALYLAGSFAKAKSVLFKQQSTLIPELRSMQRQLIAIVDKELMKLKKNK